MKGYSLYIFDFDNTLFDTSYGMKAILSRALPSVGMDYDDSMLPRFAGMTMEQIFDECVKAEAKRARFYEEFKRVVHSDVYLVAEPFPETERALRELQRRGKRIAIASGKYKYKIENLLERHGLSDVPEVVIGYKETRNHKPCPDPVLKAMSYFRIPKSETIYVGDSPHDPIAAKRAGIDSAIVRRNNGLSPDGIPCTWTIESLEELLDGNRGA